ncbi:MAG: T9SS type A sorting domain-containing protein [Muribaculaceae bacterium]|nr:T9SS type A sorting domain-containing protein [Muribaculaceae bacterium]
MNKALLLSACALMSGAAAFALPTAPKAYANQYVTCISPDGHYMASEMYGTVVITDLETGTAYTYESNGELIEYSTGDGNCWSSNGILVGTINTNGSATYWQNGEWHQLPNPQSRSIYTKAVNNDGTVIIGVGSVVAADKAPNELYNVPMIWTLGSDNTWTPEVLPYPTEDFSGRTPQGMTLVSISADGTKISAQLIDYSGYFITPYMYTKGDDGKWSYATWGGKIIDTEGIIFPDFDEDNPPVDPASHPQDFMSDSELRTDYLMAYEDWESDPQTFDYPEPEDYMTAADREKYAEAVEKFSDEAAKWNAEMELFFTQFNKLFDTSLQVTFNNSYITPDGTYVVTTAKRTEVMDPSDPTSDVTFKEPILMKANTYEKCAMTGVDALFASAIAADGTIIAYSDETNRHAYIKPYGKEWQSLYSFLQDNTDDATRTWMLDNICHTFDSTDIYGETVSYVDEPLLGVTTCTPDLSIIASNALNTWDMADGTEYYSYMIPTPKATLGVKAIAKADNNLGVKASKGGVLEVTDPAHIEVYDLQGRLVFKANAPAGQLNTGLTNGIYTVKATANGASAVLKAMF